MPRDVPQLFPAPGFSASVMICWAEKPWSATATKKRRMVGLWLSLNECISSRAWLTREKIWLARIREAAKQKKEEETAAASRLHTPSRSHEPEKDSATNLNKNPEIVAESWLTVINSIKSQVSFRNLPGIQYVIKLIGGRIPGKGSGTSVRLGHKSLRTFMKRSSSWYLPGVLFITFSMVSHSHKEKKNRWAVAVISRVTVSGAREREWR